MNTLPPKPEDSLPPRPVRGVSPRASSMRDRDRNRDRRWSPPRRTSPSSSWRRQPRDDDRYQDQSSWSSRDREDRRTRPMDRYIPAQGGHAREHRRSRSRSRSRSLTSRRRPYSSRSRSRSPRRHRRSPVRSKREPSRGSRSPKRPREEPAPPAKEEAITKSISVPETSESSILEPVPHAVNQLPPKPSHIPTGPRHRSPVLLTREKESRMKDSESARFPPKNPRRFTKDLGSHSRSRSRSKSPSHSTTKSRQSTPRPTHIIRKPKLEDFLFPVLMRDPKDSEFDADVKRLTDQRVKLEGDHVNAVRAVRRAQHELGLAMLELRSAEERRKAADRVHEKTVKGFTAFVT